MKQVKLQNGWWITNYLFDTDAEDAGELSIMLYGVIEKNC